MKDLKAKVKNIFNSLLEDKEYPLVNTNKLVDMQYIQIVNGKKLTYNDFIAHITALRSKIQSCTISYETLIQEENKVFSKHIATTTLKDGEIVRTKVFADFTFSNGKLIRCDEVTQLMSGSKEHDNLGSIS